MGLVYILVAFPLFVAAGALVMGTLTLRDTIAPQLREAIDALVTLSEREPAPDTDTSALEREISNLRALVNDIDERVEHRYRKLTARDRRAAAPADEEPEPPAPDPGQLAMFARPPFQNGTPRLVPSRRR